MTHAVTKQFLRTIAHLAGPAGIAALFVLLADGLLVPAWADGAPHVTVRGQSSFALDAIPHGVATDSSGSLYVAEAVSGRVVKFPAGCASVTCQVVLPLTGLGQPTGVAVDNWGNIFVPDVLNGVVFMLDPTGKQTTFASGLHQPSGGIAVDPQTDYYLGSAIPFRVYVADTANDRVISWGLNCNGCTVGGGLHRPYGVAVDGFHDVFITEPNPDGSNTSVLVIILGSCNTGACQQYSINLGAPAGQVTTDAAGNAFVAMASTPPSILEVPAGCTTASCTFTLPVSGLAAVRGVTTDGRGNLYIADPTSNQIIRRNLTLMDLGKSNVGSTSNYTIMLDVANSPIFAASHNVLTEGTANGEFRFVSSTCVGSVSSCQVTISYAPHGPGLRSGAIQLLDSSSSPVATIFLTAVGSGPGAALLNPTLIPIASGTTLSGGMAADAEGNIYATASAGLGLPAGIIKIPAGCRSDSCVTTIDPAVINASGLGMDGNGNLYYFNAGVNYVNKIPAGCSSFSCQVAIPTVGVDADYLAVDRYGNLLIANKRWSGTANNGGIWKLPRDCNSFACAVQLGRLWAPVGIAVDGGDNIYLSVGNNDSVVNITTGHTVYYYDKYSTPGAIAADPSGNLFVAISQGIVMFPQGCQDESCSTQIKLPFYVFGIQPDGAGNLFVLGSSQVYLLALGQTSTLNFASTTGGTTSSDSPTTINLFNYGNQPLNAVSPGLYLDSQSFTVSGCTPGFSLQPGASCPLSINFTPNAIGALSGVLTVSDNALNSSSATQVINLRGTGVAGPVKAIVGTNPAGLAFTVDGVGYSSAQTLTWTMGTNHSLATSSAQSAPGTQYTFTGWSNAPAGASVSVTASVTPQTYTAGFSTAYQLTTAVNVSGGGTVSPAGNAFYPAGTVVNLTATPSAGYTFTGWTGNVASPSLASTTVVLNAPQSVTANFAPVTSVTVATNPAGLPFSVDGTNYSSTQVFAWGVGTTHTLSTSSPPPHAGTQYTFTGWSDTGAASHAVTASTSVSNYTAGFDTSYQLTSGANPGAGGIVSPPVNAYYPAGTAVNLTATPAAGYAFVNWTGSVADANSASTTVTMSAPQTVTANFVQQVQVTVGTTPSGISFTVDGAAYTAQQTFTWNVGSSHNLSTAAPPASGGMQYAFTNWSDGGATSHTVTAALNTTSYKATFSTSYLLTTAVNTTAGGSVDPPSGSYYTAGTLVHVTATPNTGYGFTGWTGAVLTPDFAASAIFMNAPQTVTANFARQLQVTVAANPPNVSISIDGTAYYGGTTQTWLEGATHTLATTTPWNLIGTKYDFSNWSDGGAISHTVTASALTTSYTANFTTSYQLTAGTNIAAGGSVSPVSGTYYASGTVVSLTATPNPGYRFVNWTGPVANANSSTTNITMSAPQTVIANFTDKLQVTVSCSDPAVSFSVDGIPYVGTTMVTWILGSNHNLSTTSPQSLSAGTQYVFAAWSDGGAISHQVTASEAVTSYSVHFNTAYQLTTRSSPANGGSISPSSGGYYPPGTAVNLSATPAPGFVFSGWTGAVANAGSAITSVVINGPTAVTANFTPLIQVSVRTSPPGLAFSVDGSSYTIAQTLSWVPGSTHTIATAVAQTPAAGTLNNFTGWSDSGALSHTVIATAGVNAYTAAFSTSYQLMTAASGGGSVSPTSGTYYLAGTSVPVAAIPAAGYIFAGWNGQVSNPSSASATVTMTGPMSVAASFTSALSVTPSIDFGVVYRRTTVSKNVTVTNRGLTPIAITKAVLSSVSGGSATEFVITNQCPASLAGGASCSILVAFTGGAYYSPQTATLALTDSAPDSAQNVTLSAVVINPVALLGSTSISYSTTSVTGSTSAKVKLKNTGDTTLTISGITISGPNAASFQQTSDCASSLVSGDSCTITVTFAPLVTGKQAAVLTVTDNDLSGSQTVSLQGSGR